MRFWPLLIMFGLLLTPVAQAAFSVASSTNYWIVADSLNFAGTTSTSSNYRVDDTAGELATGVASSSTYQIRAGYREMIVSSLAITMPSNVSLSPDLNTAGGGTANGSVIWSVTSPAGYSLAVRDNSTPALQTSVGQSFGDYGGSPDFNWSVSSDSSAFGFSPEGDDLTDTYKNDGSNCGSGSGTTGHCWDGFSTTDQTVATKSTGPNTSRSTTLKLRAEIGADKTQTRGGYTATIIVTATGL